MEAIADAYQSSDDDNNNNNDDDDDLNTNTNSNNHNHNNHNNTNNSMKSKSKSLILAPDIDTSTSIKMDKYHDMNTREIFHNPSVDVLFGRIEGPLRKHIKNRNEEFKPKQTTLAGYVDIENVDGLSFAEQYHTFESFGYAIDPSDGDKNKQYIGDKELLSENEAMTIFNQSNKMIKQKRLSIKKRLRNNDVTDISGYLGPWAPTYKTKEEEEKYQSKLNKHKQEWKPSIKRRKLNDNISSDEDDEETIKQKRERARKYSESIENTEFHGNDEELYDYQGRTYMHCKPEYRKRGNSSKYYIPKKRIWQYIGHKEGVNSIQFIPKTGHLLLSASNDNTCKLWSVYENEDDNKKRKCLRTFNGHSGGVRNIYFNKSGDRFLSTSYDEWIKVWDTEKGKVIWRGTSGILAFNAKFYPENENEFICGQKNKLAVQWDIRYNKIIQKYDEHLSAVNDILFIDNNRRFATTSDDKKIFIWDYGTPVVIKHISEPHLHSVPFLKLHPNKKWFLGQSMDNKIVCYSAINKIGRLNNKKQFAGHLCAGYAIQLDISYDGNIIMSGDANGNIYFWDWKTTKFYNKIQCHKKVTMGAIWHPVKTSLIATCSWDATICLWD